MTVAFRWLVRISLSTALLAISTAAPGRSSTPDQKQVNSQIASRVFLPEVHLRKLHLVRPDLIPYPIYFEIYC